MIERDELLKMARDSGFEVHDRKGHIRCGLDLITGEDGYPKFERLMNAILERAALECQAFGGIISGDECAENIRDLKTKE